MDHRFLRFEHGFENRLSQLNRGRVTANSTKHAKLPHQATISCIEVPAWLRLAAPETQVLAPLGPP